MPLNKVKPGSNMYQGWITHTHNHLGGACPHACSYCSTQDMARRFPVMKARYSGPPSLIDKELDVDYGTGKTIFVENCSDLFAEGIPMFGIANILRHCLLYPQNQYVFQTKNPGRVNDFLKLFPPRFMIGTTAETNRGYREGFAQWSQAPPVYDRLSALRDIFIPAKNKFITVEPIIQFKLYFFLEFLLMPNVGAIYIGADSKSHGLPEPTGPEIGALIKGLRGAGKTVILKSNLKRLYKEE